MISLRATPPATVSISGIRLRADERRGLTGLARTHSLSISAAVRQILQQFLVAVPGPIPPAPRGGLLSERIARVNVPPDLWTELTMRRAPNEVSASAAVRQAIRWALKQPPPHTGAEPPLNHPEH